MTSPVTRLTADEAWEKINANLETLGFSRDQLDEKFLNYQLSVDQVVLAKELYSLEWLIGAGPGEPCCWKCYTREKALDDAFQFRDWDTVEGMKDD